MGISGSINGGVVVSEKTSCFEPFCGLHYASDSDVENKSMHLDSVEDKSFILSTYINYFTNLVLEMIKVRGLPKDVDSRFVIRTLINRGSIAFFKANVASNDKSVEIKIDREKGTLIAQPFTVNGYYNYYGLPTRITISSPENTDGTFSGTNIDDSDDFEIVRLNPMATALYPTIYYFSNKLVEVQRAIDVNVYNNQTPLITEGTSELSATIAQAIRQWGRQLKHIVLAKDRGAKTEDIFGMKDIGVEWKASKMVEVVQYYKTEFFTMLGINHTPFEKKANLVIDEVKSNSQILALTIDSMINSLNEDAKKVNEKFGTEIYFEYSLDSIYGNDSMSTVESKNVAGIISDEEEAELKLKEKAIENSLNDIKIESVEDINKFANGDENDKLEVNSDIE